jgi:hypothetical protein
MSLWVDIPVGAYKIGKELGLWEKFLNRFKSKRKILVLGASGAGKTRFVDSLAPKLPVGQPGHQRTVNVQKKKATINKTPFILVDTPGQVHDEAKRKKAITDAIRDKVEGIINVVCHGYHEAEEAGSFDAVPRSTGKIAKEPYLKRRQKVELDLLAEWVPAIDEKTAKWLLTIVTKADLWWPDTEGEVRRAYQEGEYAEEFDDFLDIHYVLPYCSVIEPFYGTRTSGVFGDHHRAVMRENLLQTILRLSGVEE